MLKYILALIVVVIGVYFYNEPSSIIHSFSQYIPCMKSAFHSASLTQSNSGTAATPENKSKIKLFTKEELKKYVKKEMGLYLSILGEVYDVTKGERHYGPEGGYHFFTGKDGSRAFITGDFSKNGLTDDVLDLEPQDLKSLFDWASLYKKDYKYKGKLIGRYFDSNGEATEYRLKVENKMKQSEFDEESKTKENIMFPPCNAEWSADQGSRVWCSKMSGGIHRDWVGVPRMLYLPGSDSHRCACVNLDNSSTLKKGNLKEYPDCHPKSSSCHVYN